MSGDTEKQLIFGIPAEWKDFEKRHPLFFERFPNLRQALHTAFMRTGFTSEPIDRFVFFYGRLCFEDFMEVLLCCGNGYGAAAQKLLRSLYERAVTLGYLHGNPEELDAFCDFHHIQVYKLVIPIEETFGKGTLDEQRTADLKTKYEEVKERFMVTACDKCGTKRVNHSWNKLDFVAMAKKSGNLGALIVPGYYIPLRDAHATLGSLMSRLEERDSGGISFIPTAQHTSADNALVTGHNIIWEVLRVQEERFKVPGLKEQIEKCANDFREIYRT